MRILIQLQLSSYDKNGVFDLATDSGYMMMINRCREFLRLDPHVVIDMIGPKVNALKIPPWFVSQDVFESDRVNYVQAPIMANALATRYDFPMEAIVDALGLTHRGNGSFRYDIVYINDPQLFRHYKAMFYLFAGYVPKFCVHSHFVDCPSSPKFPKEASLWLGQCEAAIAADWNFWQCGSALTQFLAEMRDTYQKPVVDAVRAKSSPYDDGYSIAEITSPPTEANLRFSIGEFEEATKGKVVIFVPNRVGGRGRSSDYTQCGRFLFDILPELRKRRQDFVVIAGNPNQKFNNDELLAECGPNGYLKLTPNSFNRDEYKWLARRSHVSLGLYHCDTFGGTASRELVELGTLPVWCDNYEYAMLAHEAGLEDTVLCDPNLFDLAAKIANVIDVVRHTPDVRDEYVSKLQSVVRERSSLEATSVAAFAKMKELIGV